MVKGEILRTLITTKANQWHDDLYKGLRMSCGVETDPPKPTLLSVKIGQYLANRKSFSK